MSYEYRTIDEAYEEAAERLGDDRLQRAVNDYLGGIWPPGFEEVTEPTVVFAPYLGRAASSEIGFQRAIADSGFESTIATYQKTEFVTANPEVVACYRPPLELPQQQRRRSWIVTPEKRMGSVAPAETVYGCDVVDYWQGIRATVYEENRIPQQPTVDFSEWYDSQARRFGWRPGDRNKAPGYYKGLMGVYASGRAVLYDTPPTNFFTRVMQPAIEETKDTLGVEPIIICGPKAPSPDWVDLSFLDQSQAETLAEKGKIA